MSSSLLRALLAIVLCVIPGGAANARGKPTVLAGRERLLVLPLDFKVLMMGMSRVELMTEKTVLANQNLNASLQKALQREQGLTFLPMPELNSDQHAVLQEQLSLLHVTLDSVLADFQSGYVPWRSWKRGQIDAGLGKGLAFLADETGADNALFVSGTRGFASAGVALFSGAFFFSGYGVPLRVNEQELTATVIDLRSGDIVAIFKPQRGLLGQPYEVPGANTWMRAVFDRIPDQPLNQPQANPPRSTPHEPYHGFGFSILEPAGWRHHSGPETTAYSRHGAGLEMMRVYRDEPARGGQHGGNISAFAEAEVARWKGARSEDIEALSITAATLGGLAGFRAEFVTRGGLLEYSLRLRHVIYGAANARGTYVLTFDAPAIYYFDRHLPEFEASVASFKLR